MVNFEFNDVIALGRILKSNTCLLILNYLFKKDASNQDIYRMLKLKVGIRYRSSAFEALKRIKKAGLVEKYYDDKKSKIMYKLKFRQVSLNFDGMNLQKS